MNVLGYPVDFNQNNAVTSVVVSGFTAITVTIGYDFLLKPYLEARIAHIKSKSQNWQNLINAFKEVGLRCGILKKSKPELALIYRPELITLTIEHLILACENIINSLALLELNEIDETTNQLAYMISFMQGRAINLNTFYKTLVDKIILTKLENDYFNQVTSEIITISNNLYLFDTYFHSNFLVRQFVKIYYKNRKNSFIKSYEPSKI